MKKGRDLLKTICRRSSTLPHPVPQMDFSERYCYNPTLRWNPQVEEYFVKAYGAAHFSRITQALMQPSCYSCVRVNTLKTTSDAVIEKLLKIIWDTGFDADGINGVKFSKRGAYAYFEANQKQSSSMKENGTYQNSDEYRGGENPLLRSLEKGPVSKCQIPGLDYVVFVKGSGPHTIDYGYASDTPPKEIIVSRKCAEAVLRGAQVYAPGVLACSANVEKGELVAVSAAVEQPGHDGCWAVGITRGTVLLGFHADPHFVERSGMYIGLGTTTMSRAGIFRVSEGVAVDMNYRIFKLPSFHGVLEGEIFLQNLPSIITAHALDPQRGDRVLDMCAAPGGKTTAIAILMKDDGEVVAVDRSHNKVLNIQKLAAEMGLNCITTYKLDALKAVSRRNESGDMINNTWSKATEDVSIQSLDSLCLGVENMLPITPEGLQAERTSKQDGCVERGSPRTYTSQADIRKNGRRLRNGPGRNQCMGGRVDNSRGFLPNSFDRVLLDAPCSALGLRPRLFAGEETINSLRAHAKYQRRMFDQAVQLVRPSGVIVYSTCTINPGENEALVRYALDTYKFLSLAAQHPRIGGPGIIGCYNFSDGYIEEWLRPGEEELVQRFDPSSPLDTIGFFVAKFDVGSKDA